MKRFSLVFTEKNIVALRSLAFVPKAREVDAGHKIGI